MSIKLRNRKAAEAQLGQFVEDMSLPPKLVGAIVDGEVNETYMQSLILLHSKLEFFRSDPRALQAAALADVDGEVERLRARAAAKVREFLLQRFYGLRKPKTNIQVLQQSVLLKYKYGAKFLQQHGPEVFPEVRQAYLETLSRIYRSALSKYVLALNALHAEVAGKLDLLTSEEGRGGAARAGPASARGRVSLFALGARSSVLHDLDGTPPLVVHQAEASGERHPYEVLFRSSHKLLMDSATSEFFFCEDFWAGDGALFDEVFAPAVAAVEEGLALHLSSCHDLVSLTLMLRINHGHQVIMFRRRAPCLDAYLEKVNLLLWPKYRAALDAQLASLRNVSERSLMTEDLGGHWVLRRYAELVAGAHSLASCSSDSQLEQSLERLRLAACELLGRMAKLVTSRRSRLVFLINNYELVLSVLREAAADPADPGCAGADRAPTAQHFSELLAAQLHLFVEEELLDQFNPLITFVKRAEEAYKHASGGEPLPQFGAEDAEPVLRDFGAHWRMSIEEIHRSISASFGTSQRALDILQRTLSQLLLFYTRLTGPEGVLMTHCGPAGAALCRSAVPTSTMLAEVKRMVTHR